MKISNLRNNQMVLDKLYTLMDHQVWNKVINRVYDQVWNQVWNQDEVHNRVINQVLNRASHPPFLNRASHPFSDRVRIQVCDHFKESINENI